MKKYITVISLAILIIAFFIMVIVFKTDDGGEIKKHYDLGYKYLQEMDYEQAIASFNAIIEIDPLNVDAYIGMADAYIGLGDYNSAIQILEKGYKALEFEGDTDGMSRLSEKLAEITPTSVVEDEVLQTTEEDDVVVVYDSSAGGVDDTQIIKIKHIIELATINGENLKNWTLQRLIDEYGLVFVEMDEDGTNYVYGKSSDRVYVDNTCFVAKEVGYSDDQSLGVFFWNDHRRSFVEYPNCVVYEEELQNTVTSLTDASGKYYEYIKNNGITNTETFLNSIGISDEMLDKIKKEGLIFCNSDIGKLSIMENGSNCMIHSTDYEITIQIGNMFISGFGVSIKMNK